MRGKHSSLSSLAAHKKLLLAESAINRVQFGRDWECLCEETHHLAHQARSVAKIASTGAALLASGSVLRRMLFRRKQRNHSWVGNLINGARYGISIWQAFRPRTGFARYSPSPSVNHLKH